VQTVYELDASFRSNASLPSVPAPRDVKLLTPLTQIDIATADDDDDAVTGVDG